MEPAETCVTVDRVALVGGAGAADADTLVHLGRKFNPTFFTSAQDYRQIFRRYYRNC